MVIVERGNCTFQEKAESVKKVENTAFGVLNVSYSRKKI
jgi:hypothetical protein